MIPCLIGFLIAVLVVAIVVWAIESVIEAPPKIVMLIRVIAVLLLLARAVECIGGRGHLLGVF